MDNRRTCPHTSKHTEKSFSDGECGNVELRRKKDKTKNMYKPRLCGLEYQMTQTKIICYCVKKRTLQPDGRATTYLYVTSANCKFFYGCVPLVWGAPSNLQKNEKQKKGEKNMKAETIVTAILVASVAVLVCYFVYVAICNFNLDLFVKSLMY